MFKFYVWNTVDETHSISHLTLDPYSPLRKTIVLANEQVWSENELLWEQGNFSCSLMKIVLLIIYRGQKRIFPLWPSTYIRVEWIKDSLKGKTIENLPWIWKDNSVSKGFFTGTWLPKFDTPPRTHLNYVDMVICILHFSAGEAETSHSLGLAIFLIRWAFVLSEIHWLQKQCLWFIRNDAWICSLYWTSICAHMHFSPWTPPPKKKPPEDSYNT